MESGLYIQGIGLGLAAAAPLGPVNIEIIRRAITFGFLRACILGLGACSADVIYLTAVLAGASWWAQDPTVAAAMMTAGGLLLIVLAALTLRGMGRATDRALTRAHEQPTTGRALAGGYATGLAMTLTNPMTIVYWIGVSAAMRGQRADLASYAASAAGVVTGTVGWVLSISTATALLARLGRTLGGDRALRAMMIIANVAGAGLLAGFALVFLARALPVLLD